MKDNTKQEKYKRVYARDGEEIWLVDGMIFLYVNRMTRAGKCVDSFQKALELRTFKD